MTGINEVAKEIHENAVAHGWWDEERGFPEVLALIHSEVSEALEEYRNGHGATEIYFSDSGKPEGIPTELADVIIRVLDYCGYAGINIDAAISQKHEFSNASGAGAEVIPTQTANEIISKVKTLAPMLNEVTLLHVKGAVKFAIEGTNNAAAIHTENASITAAADTLTTVSLSGYEIVKLVQISDTVMTMSITAFESWIVNMLAEAIARKVEDLLINGTGSSQPKGIENANTWGATNSVTVAKTGALTAANVQTLIGLLPSGYDRNGKFVMNKKTLFTDFMPLQDNSKNHIVTVQNNAYFVYGYPVLLSDYVADHEAFLGDFKKVCANLAENIGVKSAYDIDTNSYKYSGIAIFDCAPAIGEAIVKLVKATA